MALIKKKIGAQRYGVYEREACITAGDAHVHGEGQVRERVETDGASESRLCIMETVLRTCEMDTGRAARDGSGKSKAACYVVALIGGV
jgi:hypothetical protein